MPPRIDSRTRYVRELPHNNRVLAVDVEELFDNSTTPLARWLARRWQGGVNPHLSTVGSVLGLYNCLGIQFYSRSPRPSYKDSDTWAFLLARSKSLNEAISRKGAFQPVHNRPWPLVHAALEGMTPFVWCGSYHPVQLKGSPLLQLQGLDDLTAWAFGLVDAEDLDIDRIRAHLDVAMTLPGFRLWVERRNPLMLPLPEGARADVVMEQRYELLDAPLMYPLMGSPTIRRAYRPGEWEDKDLRTLPQFPSAFTPFSNGKTWELLVGIPESRHSLMDVAKYPQDLAYYKSITPHLKPTGGATEFECAGVYFESMRAASLYFRVPYDTFKSRMRKKYSPEAAAGLVPLAYQRQGNYLRNTSHENNWYRLYARMEEYGTVDQGYMDLTIVER